MKQVGSLISDSLIARHSERRWYTLQSGAIKALTRE